MKKTKNKNRDAQKKRTSHKAVESVLRPEGSLWWERFVKKVGLEPGVKERGVMDGEMVKQGSLSFTCHPHVYPQVSHTCLYTTAAKCYHMLACTHFPSCRG